MAQISYYLRSLAHFLILVISLLIISNIMSGCMGTTDNSSSAVQNGDDPTTAVRAYVKAGEKKDCRQSTELWTSRFIKYLNSAPKNEDPKEKAIEKCEKDMATISVIEVQGLEISDASFSGEKAKVAATGTTVIDGQKRTGTTVYTLVKDNGIWKIDDIETEGKMEVSGERHREAPTFNEVAGRYNDKYGNFIILNEDGTYEETHKQTDTYGREKNPWRVTGMCEIEVHQESGRISIKCNYKEHSGGSTYYDWYGKFLENDDVQYDKI